MAITIQSNPQNFNTASNPCEFTFSSTNTGESNFSFLVRLDLDGAIHSFHEVFPESGTYGRFDASEIIRSYVSSVLIRSGAVEMNTSSFTVDYQIQVKEKYGEPPVEEGSFVASDEVKAINGALRHIEWIGYDYTDYALDSATANQGKYLTHFPSSQTRFCGINESIFAGLICEDASAQYTCILYDASGSSIASATDVSITLPTNDFIILDLSPQTLIADTALTLANFNDAFYYTVGVDSTEAGAGTDAMPNFTIYIDRECSLYDGQRLHWLNKFGVWESFTFRLYSEDNTNVSTKQYQKSLGVWNGENSREFNRVDGQETVISKTSEDTLTLNSDWINQELQQWLSRSLYESPRVYLEVSQGVFEPVRVNKSSYKQKQRVREGLIQENVTVNRTYKYKSQLN